ncbi:MAG: polysaccharide deacetylase family protein [Immundisolibacterales bacterium]|nr:polysaccharide deacetylase family protein [Immundisolibacterales bacterium]
MVSAHRDFEGYRGRPPDPKWPDGARLAISFVVNVEEGAELFVGDGDERNESIHEIMQVVQGVPDFCMASHFEYGTRAGYWRIADLLDRYGVRATFSSSGRAVERNPWLARDALERGHEIAAHGWRWEGQAEMEEAAERDMIARTYLAIEGVCGAPPAGWHTKSSPSVNTRRLLVEHGGFAYDSDAYDDDLPYTVEVAGKSHVVLPYAFDTNDMRFQAGRGFDHAGDFARYCVDAFEWLWEEGARTPRMMSVGLHLRIIGRPGRIAGLDRLLAAVTSREGVWIARRDAIARHWRERMGIASGWTATP